MSTALLSSPDSMRIQTAVPADKDNDDDGSLTSLSETGLADTP